MDILSSVQFDSAIYFKHTFHKRWGMDIPKGKFHQFHMVTSGSCKIQIADATHDLFPGDLVLIFGELPHQLFDQEGVVCKAGSQVVQEVMTNEMPFPNSDPSTELVCGHFALAHAAPHPLLKQLPQWLLLRKEDYGRKTLINSLLDLIVDEMNVLDNEAVVKRLAETIFLAILKHVFTTGEVGPFFGDHRIHTAVQLIHSDTETNWKTEELAKEVGMSRTSFHVRFHELVGETPIQYLSEWKLMNACDLLVNTQQSIASIATDLGYQSASAFNRKFRLTFNVTPGKYRSAQSA